MAPNIDLMTAGFWLATKRRIRKFLSSSEVPVDAKLAAVSGRLLCSGGFDVPPDVAPLASVAAPVPEGVFVFVFVPVVFVEAVVVTPVPGLVLLVAEVSAREGRAEETVEAVVKLAFELPPLLSPLVTLLMMPQPH